MKIVDVITASAELTLLGWIFTGLLLALLVISILAGQGTLPLNGLVGIRLPALMSSDERWRAGHQAAVVPSVIIFVVALAFSLLGLIAPVAYIVTIVAFVGGFAWVTIRASVVAGRVTE
jgi:hypothetical protein